MSESGPISGTVRRVFAAWTKDDPLGLEAAALDVRDDRLVASGVAIGTDPLPYHLEYRLETVERFVTSQLVIEARGNGWGRSLELRRDRLGAWSILATGSGEPALLPAGGTPDLAGAFDVDIGFSPLTNSPPVLRNGLLGGGGPVDLVMAWVSVPDLGVHRSTQRYQFLRYAPTGQSVVRFAGSGPFGEDYVAEITFDADGLVADYPALARRVLATVAELP